MDNKQLIIKLGFAPKENAVGIFSKKYQTHDNYCIEVDFDKEIINYGNLIISDSKTTQNFSQSENWVILECVDRLLNKGYKPQNIILEKTWGAGHGTSGRLDICVTRDDGSEYLLVECKTYGKEFDKELTRMNKDGGQLFTYFKFSSKADVLMLYASEFKGKSIVFKNEIVKIEDDYRTGDVKDFYDKWNKLTKDNGVFDSWVKPYYFENKALTINELKEIKQEDSSFIFNRFLEILRHNVVSDKPNAFNKIFTLFLCKIYDEKINEGTDNELGFQWREGVDDDISFQLRLTDLYKEGMWEFLEKKVTDFSEDEFEQKYKNLEDSARRELLNDFKKIRLEKNNEFAIKEVYDEKSFKENAKVVKQVVELLQKYKIRYAKKQQYLSDFFEMLLTTGLKQESGQFFTPVPIAQFIIKSLPIDNIVDVKLKEGKRDELLPYIIDYAAGSGHFITESMHEIQRLLNKIDINTLRGDTKKFVDVAQRCHFDWALRYIYGIEKDYRLVKVGKVGCYLHGDGLANVIHSDGLSNFKHADYKEKLQKTDKDFKQDNKQFDIVVSNPPYSVSAFKNAAREYYKDDDFDLYGRLTDNSSEIECLFVERTKQLLKDGGVAGVILPSSILSNAGIYTKAREIILQYFDIVAITELGSNTFMATGTNTVVLFLRRRNNYDSLNLRKSIDKFFTTLLDGALNGIENPVSKYVTHVWEGISFVDYITLLKKIPNKAVEGSELYQEYRKKIKAKTDKEFWSIVIERESEKLYYFLLTYPQKVVLVKSGEKDAEKRFLGYEFSNRRGSEGIHPIQRGKTIEECTKLFDAKIFDNPQKASTYIYKAFAGNFDFPINESLSDNISRANLVDLLTFDRTDFEKNISLTVKKKVEIESKWEIKRLDELAIIEYGDRIVKKNEEGNLYPVYGGGGETFKSNKFNRENRYIVSRFGMSPECVRYVDGKFFLNDSGLTVSAVDSELISQTFLDLYLYLNQYYIYLCGRGVAQKNLDMESFNAFPIPLPPKDVQAKIVAEIEQIEEVGVDLRNTVDEIRGTKDYIIEKTVSSYPSVYMVKVAKVLGGKRIPKGLNFALNKTDFPYIRVSDFRNGSVDIESLKYIDANVFEQIKSYTISKDDVYISIAGTIGLVGVIPEQLDGKSLTENAAKLIINSSQITKEFLYYCLSSSNLQKQIKDNTKTVSVPKLALKRIETLQIPLPSIAEQQKIVAEIEVLEKQIAEAQKIIDGSTELKNTVLKKYL